MQSSACVDSVNQETKSVYSEFQHKANSKLKNIYFMKFQQKLHIIVFYCGILAIAFNNATFSISIKSLKMVFIAVVFAFL